jgi:hypothetical protein
MRSFRSKVTKMMVAAAVLVPLVALVPMAVVSPAASAQTAQTSQTCTAPLTQAAADAAMLNLKNGAFSKVDRAFNASPAGLDPNYIATLGYFVDQTQVIAYGPFQQTGPQLGPGATAAIGITESSQLQAFFEGGLKAAYGPRTTLAHQLPTVSTLWAENRRVTVNSRANVFDNNQPPRLVAIVRGLGQWYIPCDPNAVPEIDWIHFTLQVLIPAP